MRSFVVLVLLAVGLPAGAQLRTSAIGGRVLDPAGRPVMGAQVTVRSLDRGTVRTSATGADGGYLLAPLELGRYEVEVEHPGFSRSLTGELVLTLDRQIQLVHQLKLAPAGELVTVAAEAVAVDASAATVSGRMAGEDIQALPLNGRDLLQLALVQPGIHAARAHAQGGNTGFGLPLSISGSRPGQNSVRLDGVHVMGQTGGSPGSLLGMNLGVDAIQEFVVLSSSFSAVTGRAPGGVIHAVTRSGQNAYHGGAAYFHRNSAPDARNFFDLASTAAFRRHQFGGLLSGPIRRNRTFFFTNAEGLRQFEGRTTINTTIADAVREGRLRSGTVAVDPGIRPFLELLPRPNQAVLGDTGLFLFPNPDHASERFVTSRFDHQAGASDAVFLRYTYEGASRRMLTNFAIARQFQLTRMHSLAAEHTRIVSPRLVNTARLGWFRSDMDLGSTHAISPAADDPSLAFVPRASGPGVVSVAGLSVFEGGSRAADADLSRFDSYQFYEDLSWNRTGRLLRMGGYAETTRFDFDSRSSPLGEFTFATVADLLRNVPLRFRAMLPGTDSSRRFRQSIFAWYLQDSWRIRGGLTLELGVRHEWITVPTEAEGKLSTLDRLTDAVPRTAPPLFRNPSVKNLVPRAGLAWDPLGRGRTVLRAGYGIYPDPILSQYLLIAGVRNPPFFLYADARNLAAGGFPSNAYRELVARPRIDLRMERLDPQPRQPYVQHWNASLVQAVTRVLSLQATYAGSHGVHLSTLVEDANLAAHVRLPDGRIYFPAGGSKLNPAFGMIRNRLFDGHSFYHSLQTAVQSRRKGGFQGQAAFTWSKSIDDDSSTFARTDSSNSIGIPVDGIPGFNRGLSNHDVRRHVSIAASWQAPRRTRFVTRWLSGWKLGALITAGSGLPFSATLAYDAARTGTSRPDYRGGQRPDVNPGFRGSAITRKPEQWFRPEAFQRPAPGFLGNLGRNTMTGPAWFSADANLAREFGCGSFDRLRFSLRVEAFNLTNHTNFDLPGGPRSEVFTATGVREDAGRITSAGPARKFQVGLRLSF